MKTHTVVLTLMCLFLKSRHCSVSIDPPGIAAVLEGSNLTLSCSSDCPSPTTYSWSFQAGHSSRELSRGQQLVLNNLKQADNGVYTCSASHSATDDDGEYSGSTNFPANDDVFSGLNKIPANGDEYSGLNKIPMNEYWYDVSETIRVNVIYKRETNSRGKHIGIAIGTVAIVAVLVMVSLLIIRRKFRAKSDDSANTNARAAEPESDAANHTYENFNKSDQNSDHQASKDRGNLYSSVKSLEPEQTYETINADDLDNNCDTEGHYVNTAL